MFRKKANMDDDEMITIIEEFKNGSSEAFSLLYHQYHKRVYRFCLRMLGNEESAEDAFQEVFIKVYEHKKDLRGKNFAAWLFTIARHTCLNILRSKKEFDSFDELFHGKTEANTKDIGLQECIQKALVTLPVSLREALILREYEDCSYKEIAEISEIALSLAKVRVFRARELMRKLLAPLRHELNES
jgi:RNA polymerase sigma-70 factor (ECF subfamily)